MTNRLLFCPLPFEDETAASILIRAAKENGHASVYQLLAGCGISVHEQSLRAALIDSSRFEFIVKQLGLTDGAAALSHKRVNSSIRAPRRYRSAVISDRFFRRHDARVFCAACLREHPYWRQQWLVRPFSACTRHSCLLIDRCPNCKRGPSLARGDITSCNHCQTSLLSTDGDTANIEAMSAIEDMLVSKDTGSLNQVLEFWDALARTDRLEDTPLIEYTRLEAAVSFLRGDIAAFEHVAALVVPRLPLMGPSMQLLPFLSGSPALNRFAEEVISAVWPLTKIDAGESRLSHLSKSEVCSILKLTPAKLTQLITSGDINWPCDGKRQQKIAITESELRRHGFSQTEILCMYSDAPGYSGYG